jgi:hypothetical protein
MVVLIGVHLRSSAAHIGLDFRAGPEGKHLAADERG